MYVRSHYETNYDTTSISSFIVCKIIISRCTGSESSQQKKYMNTRLQATNLIPERWELDNLSILTTSFQMYSIIFPLKTPGLIIVINATLSVPCRNKSGGNYLLRIMQPRGLLLTKLRQSRWQDLRREVPLYNFIYGGNLTHENL